MNKLPTCCEFHHKVECGQGDFCPARATCAITAFYAETEGVMPMATGCSLKALPNPARQPLPVIHKPRTSLAMPTLKWLGVALLFTFLSALTAQVAERFFN